MDSCTCEDMIQKWMKKNRELVAVPQTDNT